MSELIYKPGMKFGRLTMLRRIDRRNCLCLCDCGTEKIVNIPALTRGGVKSCGCLKSELSTQRMTKHGGSTEYLYHIWQGILARCYISSASGFHNYGGRGIAVCSEWKDSYSAFREWATGHGLVRGLEIDRRDNDGPYSPENCRVVPHIVNQNNNRDTVKVTAFGEIKSMSEWSRDARCPVPYMTLVSRLNYGMKPEQAITQESR